MRSIVLFLLIGFCFVLPISEALKNIFGVFAILCTIPMLISQSENNKLSHQPYSVEFGFACIALSATAVFAGLGSQDFLNPTNDYLSQALDWLLIPAICWVWVMLRPVQNDYRLLSIAIAGGTVVAIIAGFAMWSGEYPKLASVGHVNQSAMYVVFGSVSGFYLLFNRASRLDAGLGLLTIVCAIFFIGPSRSLVAFGGMLALIGSALCTRVYFKRSRLNVALVLGFVAVCGGFFLAPSGALGPYAGLRAEMLHRLTSESDPLSQRDRLVASAWFVASDSITGFGINSFGDATSSERMRAEVSSNGGDWALEQGKYFSSGHGHNLFASLLVERGWFGVIIFGSVMLWILLRLYPSLRQGELSAVAGLFALSLSALMGLGQTTLHVEHGQLALLLMASGIFVPACHGNRSPV